MYTSSEVRGDDKRHLLKKTELANIGCPFTIFALSYFLLIFLLVWWCLLTKEGLAFLSVKKDIHLNMKLV